MADDGQAYDRRVIDPAIARLETAVAVIQAEIKGVRSSVEDLRTQNGRQSDRLEDLSQSLNNPTLSATGRTLYERSVNNAERITRVETEVSEIKSWRSQVQGVVTAARFVIGTSLLSFILAVIALWTALTR